MKTRFFSLLALLALLLTFSVACKPVNSTDGGTVANTGSETAPTTAEPVVTPVPVRVYTMNGTTGFGMAKLMEDAANGAFATEKYSFEVKSDFATEVLPALTNGDADIAAIPTNGASVAYNKTQGKVKILAVNTLGCLYLVGNTAVNSLADLEGKTVYAPAQNPTFIFGYLCKQNNVNVTVDNTYAAPANLMAAVAAGEVEYAVLPEPMVTMAVNKATAAGRTLSVSLDLTAEWDKLPGMKDTLVQGCVVVRTAFLEEHPEAVENFLRAYESSINYLNANVAEAAALVVRHGIFAQEAVAKVAIPKCNVAYVAGDAMKQAMQTYLGILKSINATAIGGALPGDDFYYSGT